MDNSDINSGVALIAKERQEQIEKHSRTVDYDANNNHELQLLDAAKKLLFVSQSSDELFPSAPKGWPYEMWDRMVSKSYKERLIIAGALIASEIDRIKQPPF